MRILLNGGESQEVMEIVYASYEDSAVIDKDDKKVKATGLMFVSAEKDEWIIPNISKHECEYICQKLLTNGYVDVSMYEEFYEIEYFE